MRALIRIRALAPVAVTIALAACASRTPSTSTPMPSREVLTAADINGKGFNSVLDALQALRPHWLQTHGTDSFFTPSEVRVFLDGNELGGTDALSIVQLASIVYIQHYNGIDATSRWGVGHSQGVIYISTHPAEHPI
jgi:hypothetical protein